MENNIRLKTVEESDLKAWWEKRFGPQADLEWMKYNGPYFKSPVESWDFMSIIKKRQYIAL